MLRNSDELNAAYSVRQLIEELQDQDPDAVVLFSCSYGDYSNTQQALPVSEVVDAESSDLVDSAYSQSGIALVKNEPEPDEDEPEIDKEEVRPIVILT